jgi:hypothetical protein
VSNNNKAASATTKELGNDDLEEDVLVEEQDPDITDDMILGQTTPFQKDVVTVALQILPDDGSILGRKVIVIVKGLQVSRRVKLMRMKELEPFPAAISEMLSQLEMEVNAFKPPVAEVKATKVATPVATNVGKKNVSVASKQSVASASVAASTVPVTRPENNAVNKPISNSVKLTTPTPVTAKPTITPPPLPPKKNSGTPGNSTKATPETSESQLHQSTLFDLL